MNIPKDPFILVSYINTKLRDEYPSLGELCKGLEIDRSLLESVLSTIGYRYLADLNRFTNL